jgi:hypothetical protein
MKPFFKEWRQFEVSILEQHIWNWICMTFFLLLEQNVEQKTLWNKFISEKKIAQRIELGVVNRLFFLQKLSLSFKSCSMYWAAPVHVLRHGQAVFHPPEFNPFGDQGLLNHLCAQTSAAPNCKSDHHKSQKWCYKSLKSGPIYHYQSILRQKKNYGNSNISPCRI